MLQTVTGHECQALSEREMELEHESLQWNHMGTEKSGPSHE